MEIESVSADDEIVPTEFDRKRQGQYLDVSEDGRTVRYTGDGSSIDDVGSIQANHPVPSKRLVYYYEVTILDQGQLGRIGIGYAGSTFKLNKQPGWEPSSYGYHGDDGKIFLSSGRGELYGPTYGTGDTIGAGLLLGKQELFFTKNGIRLKTAASKVRGMLYPTIGLHSKNEMVEVNFQHQPFLFDLEGLINEERQAIASSISSVPLAPTITYDVVRNYLHHFGYADTLSSLDAATGAAANRISKSSASTRAQLRRCIMSGDMDSALDVIAKNFGALLAVDEGHEEIKCLLYSQKYIELVRSGAIDEAVTLAQQHLKPYQGSRMTLALRDVVAVIAYPEPEKSPLSHLLSSAHREHVADAVNAAAIMLESGQSAPAKPPQSVLERLLRHLTAVEHAHHELNANQGEVFSLSKYVPR